MAGGTIDLWPLHNFFYPAVTINAAINVFTTASLTRSVQKRVFVEMKDLKIERVYENMPEFLAERDPRFKLLQVVFEFFRPPFGFHLCTESESPVGGGLGGSSSLIISIIKVFSEALQMKFSEAEMVHLAHNLESRILGVPTGTQDYFPAVSGGVNALIYGMDQIKREPLNINFKEFEKHLIVVYTGRPHHSGLNNWQILKDCIDRSSKGHKITHEALGEIQTVSFEMREHLLRGELDLPRFFEKEFSSRLKLSEVFSSPEIERLREISLKAGATSLKICGAGGGGCVLIWCDPKNRPEVLRACQDAKFQILENIQVVEKVEAVQLS